MFIHVETCAIQLFFPHGHLPKLVLNHRNTFPVLFSKDVVQQGSFTSRTDARSGTFTRFPPVVNVVLLD